MPDRRLLGPVVAVAAVFCVGVAAVWWMTEPSRGDDAERAVPGERTVAAPAALAPPAPDPAVPNSGSARIVAENALPGSPEWRIADGDARPRGIEGFADRVSGLPGEAVRLYADTPAPSFRVVAYRLGHYGGVGARRIWESGDLPGIVQWECVREKPHYSVDCSNWTPALTVDVGADWPPGQYLFKLVPSIGTATFVPYVLRDDERHSDVLVVSGMTTLLAYNQWGGNSFYAGEPDHVRVGSFDRPLDAGWAQSGIVGDTLEVGAMLESMGLDVTYTTNVDQHLRPELMKNHRLIVSGAHDEYYSLEMRDGMEAARDSGVNIVFLGANAVFRNIRFEDSPLGTARRVISHKSPLNDPLFNVDNSRVTNNWREEPLYRPESSLTGTYYECAGPTVDVDMVIVDGSAWMFEGTNVTSGQHWPKVVQQEYDRVNEEVPTPPDIQVLARSPLVCGLGQSYSDMAYYTVPSGAGVFNTGTVYFEERLGPLCPKEALRPEKWNCQLREMMANVFRTFAAGPVGLVHPAQRNLEALSHFVTVHPPGHG